MADGTSSTNEENRKPTSSLLYSADGMEDLVFFGAYSLRTVSSTLRVTRKDGVITGATERSVCSGSAERIAQKAERDMSNRDNNDRWPFALLKIMKLLRVG